MTINDCRSCGECNLLPILDLGHTPLADRLLTADQLDQPEYFAPLKVLFCPACALVQISETVSPEILFGDDYPYFSSVSPALQSHFARSAEQLIARRRLGRDSLVVEAASNDGYLLKHFVDHGIPVLGIDPAKGPALTAQKRNVNTLHTFFTLQLAEQLYQDGTRADLFLANNVLAHVADLKGFVKGAALLLKDDGAIVIEVPYLLDLIDNCEFDTIYHQHLCYFSATALNHLFRAHGLYLNEIQRTSIHGGSLRLFVEMQPAQGDSVLELLEREKRLGADQSHYYLDFAARVRALIEDLKSTLHALKRDGKRIAGYGAAAKACTLMSVAGIDGDVLDYLVDLNRFKQGRYMSGNRLPIYAPERLTEDRPDYVLLLAWNFAEEVVKQQERYRKQGGHFIVPVPQVRTI